eukprot:TRINITY_DN4163_c0_g1_i14.p5 TRINITY_DN4163_c0_g1~~TRINITY_DN4163_c0_g1_i14.p5  ORF type:complete len:136 (+),score=22.26 TRINITY_DN4163_c0_g1_i14:1665-2072(+)
MAREMYAATINKIYDYCDKMKEYQMKLAGPLRMVRHYDLHSLKIACDKTSGLEATFVGMIRNTDTTLSSSAPRKTSSVLTLAEIIKLLLGGEFINFKPKGKNITCLTDLLYATCSNLSSEGGAAESPLMLRPESS